MALYSNANVTFTKYNQPTVCKASSVFVVLCRNFIYSKIFAYGKEIKNIDLDSKL